jgi:hypothetical protein
MNDNAKYWIGLVVSIITALAGQAEIIPEPYRHIVSVLGIAATAANGYMLQRPTPTAKAVKAARGRK